MKRYFENRQFVIFLGMLVAAVSLGAYQYYPVHLQKQTLRKTLIRQDEKMDEIKIHCEKLPLLHRQVKNLQDRGEYFNRQLPADQQFAQLWQEIAGMMDENRLAGQMIRPGQVECGTELCRIPIEIQCTGSFCEIFDFLRSLEGFDRLIRMEDIRLKNDAELTGRISLIAQASVYYQPEGRNK